MRRGGRWLASLLLVGVLSAGCSSEPEPSGDSAAPASPSSSIRTLTPIVVPRSGPPAGEVVADLRQSSLDAARAQMQVWLGNGLPHDVTPTSITYRDPRFRGPLEGQRLRTIPDDFERGFPLALPSRPACAVADPDRVDDVHGTVTVRYDGEELTVDVEDEARVVARYVTNRCFALDVARVASLEILDEVPVDQPGAGSVGTLVLVATPSDRPGGPPLTLDTVGGTPLLTPNGTPVWTPGVTVRGDGPARRVELPVVPARCDDHVFMEGGGSTAFRVRLHLGDRAGELLVRMSPTGAAAAIAFARDSCGLG